MALTTDMNPFTPQASGNRLGLATPSNAKPRGNPIPIRNPSEASNRIVIPMRAPKAQPRVAGSSVDNTTGYRATVATSTARLPPWGTSA